MKKKIWQKICLLLLAGVLLVSNNTYAQGIEKMKVGDKMPDLPLPALTKYYGKKMSIASFRGKYLILDFWATSCSVCITAFPEMEALQHLFDDKLQIILVNPFETNEKIKEKFEAANRSPYNTSKMRLPNLPSITGEQHWKERFPHWSIPHHVWIDPAGKVMAITGGYNANAQTVRSILRGNKVDLLFKPEQNINLREERLRLFLKDHLSSATPWSYIGAFYEGEGANAGGPSGMEAKGIIDTVAGTIRYSFLNNSFTELFKEVAYIQKSLQYGRPLSWKEMTDDPLLWQVNVPEWYMRPRDESKWDDWARRARFCYEIEVPLSKKNDIPSMMLRDLNSYFEKEIGLRAHFETMPRTCWVMRVTDKGKIPRPGSGEKKTIYPSDDNDQTYTFLNTPFTDIIDKIDNILKSSSTHSKYQLPKQAFLIDSTGISGTVDMKLTSKAWDQPDPVAVYNEFLAAYGLSIMQEVKEIEMLVVKDR